MPKVRKIDFSEFEPSVDPAEDLRKLRRLLQDAFDDVYSNLPSGATANFTTADTPAKNVTVEDGVVTDIT